MFKVYFEKVYDLLGIHNGKNGLLRKMVAIDRNMFKHNICLVIVKLNQGIWSL